jgi:hypothetical protein
MKSPKRLPPTKAEKKRLEEVRKIIREDLKSVSKRRDLENIKQDEARKAEELKLLELQRKKEEDEKNAKALESSLEKQDQEKVLGNEEAKKRSEIECANEAAKIEEAAKKRDWEEQDKFEEELEEAKTNEEVAVERKRIVDAKEEVKNKIRKFVKVTTLLETVVLVILISVAVTVNPELATTAIILGLTTSLSAVLSVIDPGEIFLTDWFLDSYYGPTPQIPIDRIPNLGALVTHDNYPTPEVSEIDLEQDSVAQPNVGIAPPNITEIPNHASQNLQNQVELFIPQPVGEIQTPSANSERNFQSFPAVFVSEAVAENLSEEKYKYAVNNYMSN